jgi:hypothetical protein
MTLPRPAPEGTPPPRDGAKPMAAPPPGRAARLDDRALLEIAVAAARFPRTVRPEAASPTPEDIERIAHRFPGFLAARLEGFAALAAAASPRRPGLRPQSEMGGAGEETGLGAALATWAARRFGGAPPAPLAQRLGVPLQAGILAAAALPAFGGLTRRDLPGLASFDSPGAAGGPPLSRLLRLLVLALRLRRPDMLDAPGMDGSVAAIADWSVVFGLAEHRLWHLLPPSDRRLLLAGTRDAPPLFLRAVLRFRPDLRAHRDNPLVLRDWLRGNAAAEYGIDLQEPPRPMPRPGFLSVVGPWRQVLGISDDCFGAAMALEQAGFPFEVIDTKPSRWLESDPDKLARLGARAAALPSGTRALFCDTLFEATFWALTHWPRFAAFRRVDLLAPWELPALPAGGWQAAARLLFDTVLTPSSFVQSAFRAAGAARVLRATSSVEVIGRHRAADALALRRRLPALPPPGGGRGGARCSSRSSTSPPGSPARTRRRCCAPSPFCGASGWGR